MRRNREHGSTLIELIITIVVVGLIAAVIGMLMLQGMRAFTAQDTKATMTTQGRLAIERIARDLRLARSRSATDIPVMGAAALTFVDTSGTTIAYAAGAGSITRNGTVLASAPTATLAFSYFQQDGSGAVSADQVWTIQVDMTFTGSNESQGFRVRVHPRNFT
jgi:Tfp pilus assembly protein PilW